MLSVASVLAAGIALAMLLASVPPGDDSAEASFARDMIAHHEAAIPMSQAVLERTDEPEVEQLARSIIAAQKTEIENMTSMVAKRVGDSAEVDLEPANGSGTKGTTTLSEAEGGGAKVVLDGSELPGSGTMYLAHIHPGTCSEEEEGGQEDEGGEEYGHSHHEHGASGEIEWPLSPVYADKNGDGTSTTVLHKVTLEGLLSGKPTHVNVHRPSSGEPPPVTCANLDEAR